MFGIISTDNDSDGLDLFFIIGHDKFNKCPNKM